MLCHYKTEDNPCNYLNVLCVCVYVYVCVCEREISYVCMYQVSADIQWLST